MTINKKQYIVSEDNSFESIHEDWNYSEENLFIKLSDQELDEAAILTLLLGQIEEIAIQAVPIDGLGEKTRKKVQLLNIYPKLEGEILLSCMCFKIYFSNVNLFY